MNSFIVNVLILIYTSYFSLHGCFKKPFYSYEKNDCKTQVDSITKMLVYISVDTLPENEGGPFALARKFEKITLKDIPQNYDPNFIIAFIVDIDGSIKGERVLKDVTNKIGRQMLEIVKAFKWIPAKCNNKNVAMLYKIPLVIDVERK